MRSPLKHSAELALINFVTLSKIARFTKTIASHMTGEEMLLLQKIAEGDEPSFRLFFDRYRLLLFNHLHGITKSKEVAEELVVDIFVKLWTGRDLLPEIRDVEGFLKKVGYNKSMDFFRTAARNQKIQRALEKFMDPVHDLTPDVIYDERELKQLLETAKKQLSPQRRIIFTLSREHGLTHEQIATRLNLSRNTVRNHMIEAVKNIKKFLKDHDNDTWIMITLFLLK